MAEYRIETVNGVKQLVRKVQPETPGPVEDWWSLNQIEQRIAELNAQKAALLNQIDAYDEAISEFQALKSKYQELTA